MSDTEVTFRRPREEEPKHLAAIRQLSCVRCGGKHVEAAHIRMVSLDWGQHAGIRTGAGGGEKPSDIWTLPLCAEHHRTGPEAEHRVGTVEFWRRAGLDPHKIAYSLWLKSPNVDEMQSIIFSVLYMGFGRIK